VSRSALVRAFAGRGGRPPYTLSDLAENAVGLLDHLGIESAHVVGISMGGMIAQTMALEYPARVRSLTSIMSTTGKRWVGWQHPRLLPALALKRGSSLQDYIHRSKIMWKLIGSPAYPPSAEEVEDKARATYERGISDQGVMRQMLAVLHQPDR